MTIKPDFSKTLHITESAKDETRNRAMYTTLFSSVLQETLGVALYFNSRDNVHFLHLQLLQTIIELVTTFEAHCLTVGNTDQGITYKLYIDESNNIKRFKGKPSDDTQIISARVVVK
ncbi:hypothetical protein ACFSJY_19245 [Thalassotalea euphylliae]|uniref:hypothetical protein n=1 Tax=Thalassotalea euphylliae TaxID=1655234 RepID=UPI00363BB09F